MVNKRYVRGIAFAVLMLSVVSFTVEALTINSTDPSGPNVNNTVGETRTFNITVNESANFTWYINESVISSGLTGTENVATSSYANSSAAAGFWNITVYAVSVIDSSIQSFTWWWTVTNAPDATPPASVTNLTMTGNGTTWLLINWTNPSDVDFDHVMIFKNSTFVANTTPNTTYSYNITGLNSGTTYEITVKTVDTTGNVNQTAANLTATTDPNTQTGNSVAVTLQNSTVTFTTVTGPGNTVEASNNSQSLPLGYTAVGSYINISTTATYTGSIEVRVSYSGLPSGYAGTDVRLYHWNDSTGKWDNVTTSVDTGNGKVVGTVSTLSPFVPGVPAKPSITKVYPAVASFETIGRTAQTFNITVDQTANVTWYINSNPVNYSGIITAGTVVSYTNTPSSSGNYNVSVTAANANGTDTEYWNWTVRPRTYATGNRIWDASKPDQFSLTYTWNPMSFPGFYYDIKNDVGNESIKITLNSYTSRTVSKGNIVYTTTPDTVNFGYSGFGSYQVIGFMADKYFAGYIANSMPPNPIINIGAKSALSSGQLHKVLIDDDTKRTISVGGTLTLQEGYVLKAKDISVADRIMLISLLKDGNEVDTATLQTNQTYVYAPSKVGVVSDLPIIMARFDSVFSGREVQAAFLKGLFQISQNPTTVKSGDQFKDMKVRSVGQDKIEMSTDSDISLSKGNTEELMGNIKIIVADNDTLRFALSVEKTGTFEVRSTVYRDSDPIDLWNPYNFGMNIGKTSIGFYYGIDDGIGNESLRLVTPLTGRTISAQNLVYTTTPEIVNFDYSGFGSYQVIGFMAEKYFAGYTSSSIPSTVKPIITVGVKSAIGSGQLHRVLIDDDTKRTISVGGTLTLQEGYVLKAKDISVADRIMLISLLKDGNEVDTATLEAGQTYVYAPSRVGSVSDLPIIIARFDSVFSGREVQAAFLRGVFQISQTPTTVKTGDQFKDMKVRSVGQDKIEMSNEGSISLDKNRIEELMGNIKLKVGDTTDNSLRFYFAVDVTPEMVANQLLIDAPAKATAGDQINVKVTAGGKAVDGASVSIGSSEIGKTDANGLLNYTLPRTMKGVQNITATKLGYQQTTRSMEILEYVDYRLSIDAPVKANQFESITVKVTYNSSVISGAALKYDNETIGATDNNGVLSYTLQTSGTHTISASKSGYITAVRDIEVRAPFSEYKALDINIMPGVVFTNEPAVIRSNITNVGTKADTRPVELIFNGTVAENRSVALAPGEIKEINFTWKEAIPGNYTVELLGQKGLLEVREEPLNLLLIGGIATGFGAIIIYLLTAKSKISLEMLRQKLFGKFGKKAAEKAVEVVTPPKQ